jgi:hypothetical protein
MHKLRAALYSTSVYLLFLGVFLYAIGFVEGRLVPKSIDSGTSGSLASSLLIDAGLLVLFAVQHSVMARPGFKRLWTRLVPSDLERLPAVPRDRGHARAKDSARFRAQEGCPLSTVAFFRR